MNIKSLQNIEMEYKMELKSFLFSINKIDINKAILNYSTKPRRKFLKVKIISNSQLKVEFHKDYKYKFKVFISIQEVN